MPWSAYLRAFQNRPWNGCSAMHRVKGMTFIEVIAIFALFFGLFLI